MKWKEPKKTAVDTEKEIDQKALKKKLAEEKKLRDKQIQNLIFSRADALTQKDKEKAQHQVKFFIGDKETSLGEVLDAHRLLLREAKPYRVTFLSEFYDELRRITGMPKSKINPHHKPAIFAVHTLRFIYNRFLMKDFIDQLYARNPFMAGLNIRNFKHFQLLNEEGQQMLEGFIQDMIRVMKKCSSISEFEEQYCKEYKLSWNLQLFN